MQEQRFIEAIIARPDDDRPRLDYAKWLDEHQQETVGAFIRKQCQMARARPTKPQTPSYFKLPDADTVELKVPEEVGRKWTKPFCQGLGVNAVVYHRGLVNEIVVDAKNLINSHDAIFRAMPIENLTLFSNTWDDAALVAEFSRVSQIASLARLKSFHFQKYWKYTDEMVTVVLGSPHLCNLRRLDLDCGGDGAASMIATLPQYHGLECVIMRGDDVNLSDDGALKLLRGPNASNLKHLELSHQMLTHDVKAELEDFILGIQLRLRFASSPSPQLRRT